MGFVFQFYDLIPSLTVLHESARGGGWPGEPLVEIGDPQELEVGVDLLSADAVRVAPDPRVLLAQWGGEVPLEGRVRRVERGPHNGLEVEVRSGLETGEQMVRYPSPRGAEDVRVEPR